MILANLASQLVAAGQVRWRFVLRLSNSIASHDLLRIGTLNLYGNDVRRGPANIAFEIPGKFFGVYHFPFFFFENNHIGMH